MPKSFANSTVILELVSETELRVRRAVVIAEDELPTAGSSDSRLSVRDRDLFLELLADPPALNKAVARNKSGRG